MSKGLCACALIAVVGGCSAAGVPIYEPEHVTTLAADVAQSQLEAIAWALKDVVVVAQKSLLRAPPGPVTERQLTSSGTLTIQGTAAQPTDTAETLTFTLAFDGYHPKINAAVPYTDWKLSSSTQPTLTLAFTHLSANDLGFVDGTFVGTVAIAQVKSADAASDVDARLTIHGQLPRDLTDTTILQRIDVSGVISSPAFGYYYNDAVVDYKNP
jgi:hypothetical protein